MPKPLKKFLSAKYVHEQAEYIYNNGFNDGLAEMDNYYKKLLKDTIRAYNKYIKIEEDDSIPSTIRRLSLLMSIERIVKELEND